MSRFDGRRRRLVSRWLAPALLVSSSLLGGASAFAANGTWNGGASATWDTTTTNWLNLTGTPWDVANGGTNFAVFNTAGATPSVTGTVWANGLTFLNTGTVSGGTITLAGSAPTITTSAGIAARIGSALAGTAGFTTTGGGTLTLSGNSSVSGTVTLGQGEVILASGAAMTNSTDLFVGASSGTATLRIQSGASLTSNKISATTVPTFGSDTRPYAAVIQEGGSVTFSGAGGAPVLGFNYTNFAATYTGSSSYLMLGGTMQLTDTVAGYLRVGRNAPASFTQTGGAVTMATTSNSALTVGDYSTGIYEISGGSVTGTAGGVILSLRGGSGTVTVSGSGIFAFGGNMFMALNNLNSSTNKGSATVNLQGGTMALNGITTGTGAAPSNGFGAVSFNFSGGTLRPYNTNSIIGSSTAANNFAIGLSGSGATLSGIDQAGSTARTLTVRATLQGAGSITVSGGTVSLQSANTHTGATTVAGTNTTLALGSAGSIASSGTVTVGNAGSTGAVLDLTAMTSSYVFGSGQTVRGIGTINIGAGKTVSSAGIWAPGNSIGSNALTGNLTLTGTSQFELGTPGTSTSASGTSDFTAVSGTLALGGNLALIDNANAGGFGSYGAGTYRLFTYGAVSGSYASITAANATTRGGIVLGGSGTSAGQGVFLNVYNLASAAGTQTVSLGNVYATNSATTTALTVANTAASNATFTETLSGSFSGVTSGFSATGSVSGITGGASNAGSLSVGLGNGLAAGVQTGTATLALFSNAVNSSGLAQQSVGSQAVTITGTVWNPAAVNTLSAVSLTNVRTSGTFGTSALTITNTAASGGYTEVLGATGSPSGFASITGSVSALAGGSSSTAISVGLDGSANTATAGLKSGSVSLSFTSTGGPGSFVPTAQTIAVTGGVYDFARANFSGTTLDFGVVHLGASVTGQNVAFGNQTVTNASYQDSLDVSATTGNARVTATGFTGLAASSGGATTNNLAVSVSTATAGSLASTLSLTLTSNANNVAGLSNGTAVTVGGGAITTTGGVFSGTASWNVNGGGSWGTGASSNWTSTESVSAAPGTFAGYTTTDSATFGTALTGGTASILLNGATPSLASIAFANTAGRYVLDQGSGGSLTLAVASGKPTVSVVAGALNEIKTAILGTSGLEKTGLGTLVLSGSNTYSGGTDITAGTLAVNGRLGGAVNVASGGVLGGSGVLSGLVTVAAGGILAPGNSPGTLSLNSGLALDASSILNFELNATNATVGSGVNDLINVTGNFTLAGILNVSGIGDFSTAADFTTWRLFNYSGGTFTNNGLTLGSMPSVGSTGKYFRIDTTTPNQVNLVIVPEPGGLALAGIGIAAAAWAVAKRRRGRSVTRTTTYA